MIINNLILHNFGVYRGSQSLEAKPNNSNKDQNITLVWGKNGCGKTTILDAVQIALFGKQARFLSKEGQSYESIVKDSIHKNTFETTGQSTASLEVDFTASLEGVSIQYTVERSWRLVDTDLTEDLRVSQNKIYSETLSKNWNDQVDRFFPSRLSNLFFFNGEHVDSYSSTQALSRLLREVLGEMLGVDIIDRLDEDILKFQQDQTRQISNKDKSTEIIRKELIIETIGEDIRKLEAERADIGTNRVDKKKVDLAEVESKFNKIGGDLFERRRSIESRHKILSLEINTLEEELRTLVGAELPFFMIVGLVRETCRKLRESREAKEIKQKRELFEHRDRFIIASLVDLNISDSQILKLDTILQTDLKRFDCASSKDEFGDIDMEVYDEIEDLRSILAGNLGESVGLKLKEIKAKRVEMEDLNEALNAIPKEIEVRDIIGKRDTLLKDLNSAIVDMEAVERDISRQRHNVEGHKRKLTELVLDWTRLKYDDENARRVFEHTFKVKETLAELRKRVLLEGIGDIERLTTQCYCQVARKNAGYKQIQIDVESYEFTLMRNDGTSMGVDQLSAGERQLFCFALIWALRMASGRPLPLLLDTPLSRLDSEHRKAIVEHFIPRVSRQVILLSTDEEIVGSHFDFLKSRINRLYNLRYDELCNSTEIVSLNLDNLEATR